MGPHTHLRLPRERDALAGQGFAEINARFGKTRISKLHSRPGLLPCLAEHPAPPLGPEPWQPLSGTPGASTGPPVPVTCAREASKETGNDAASQGCRGRLCRVWPEGLPTSADLWWVLAGPCSSAGARGGEGVNFQAKWESVAPAAASCRRWGDRWGGSRSRKAASEGAARTHPGRSGS